MNKIIKKSALSNVSGFDDLLSLFEQTQSAMQNQAAHTINIALVVRNWLFGWYIVEYQQNGADRAEYGNKLLKKLSNKLKIKGCSERSLALFCKFYRCYTEILQAVPAKSLESLNIQQRGSVKTSEMFGIFQNRSKVVYTFAFSQSLFRVDVASLLSTRMV